VTLAFRNVDADVADPVSSWPQEALRAALERGDLIHWRGIAVEIRDWPWGRVARSVEGILRYSRPYRVAGLMERAIDAARPRAARSEIEEVASRIRGLRESSGLSVSEFCEPGRYLAFKDVDLPGREGGAVGGDADQDGAGRALELGGDGDHNGS
jgi:hypothetical protein